MQRIIITAAIIYLAIINAVAFVAYGVDKYKAKNNKWRIPEATLIGFAALGGGMGALAGMFAWHHKTRKPKFVILVPVFLVLWAVGLYFLYDRFGLQ